MTLKSGQVETEFWESEASQLQRQIQHLKAIEPLLGSFNLSWDQRVRLADIAIEIAGHRRQDIDALADAIRSIGGSVAISSIQINTWMGRYNKQTMSERLLRRFDVGPDEIFSSTAFVGDSRNDAPMFAYFINTFGVANILPVLDDLAAKPRWICLRPAGLGFVDVAKALISAKK